MRHVISDEFRMEPVIADLAGEKVLLVQIREQPVERLRRRLHDQQIVAGRPDPVVADPLNLQRRHRGARRSRAHQRQMWRETPDDVPVNVILQHL